MAMMPAIPMPRPIPADAPAERPRDNCGGALAEGEEVVVCEGVAVDVDWVLIAREDPTVDAVEAIAATEVLIADHPVAGIVYIEISSLGAGALKLTWEGS